MKKKIVTIIFLLFAGVVGFYAGLTQRPIVVSVHEVGTTTSQTIVLKGQQVLSSNPFGGSPSGKPSRLPWYVTRASALAAFLLMFAIIIWGTGMTTGYTYKITNPVKAWSIHKYMSISLGVLILVHMFSLLLDKFVNFNFVDILVPFVGTYKQPYLTLGIVGFYILAVVIFSSLLIRITHQKFWRALHYLVYPLFVISLFHGLLIGTDTVEPVVMALYWVTGIIFFFLLIYRFVIFRTTAHQ